MAEAGRRKHIAYLRSVFNEWSGGHMESDDEVSYGSGSAPASDHEDSDEEPAAAPLPAQRQHGLRKKGAARPLKWSPVQASPAKPPAKSISSKNKASAGVGPLSAMTPVAKARVLASRRAAPAPVSAGLNLEGGAAGGGPAPVPPTEPPPNSEAKLQPLAGHAGFFINKAGRVFSLTGKLLRLSKDPRK